MLRTGNDGSRLLEIRIPRAYFHRNEWALDTPEAMLGVRLELTVADPTPGAAMPFPCPTASRRTARPSPTRIAWCAGTSTENETAPFAVTLRLSRQPCKAGRCGFTEPCPVARKCVRPLRMIRCRTGMSCLLTRCRAPWAFSDAPALRRADIPVRPSGPSIL